MKAKRAPEALAASSVTASRAAGQADRRLAVVAGVAPARGRGLRVEIDDRNRAAGLGGLHGQVQEVLCGRGAVRYRDSDALRILEKEKIRRLAVNVVGTAGAQQGRSAQ
jgi:hypothetical protein